MLGNTFMCQRSWTVYFVKIMPNKRPPAQQRQTSCSLSYFYWVHRKGSGQLVCLAASIRGGQAYTQITHHAQHDEWQPHNSMQLPRTAGPSLYAMHKVAFCESTMAPAWDMWPPSLHSGPSTPRPLSSPAPPLPRLKQATVGPLHSRGLDAHQAPAHLHQPHTTWDRSPLLIAPHSRGFCAHLSQHTCISLTLPGAVQQAAGPAQHPLHLGRLPQPWQWGGHPGQRSHCQLPQLVPAVQRSLCSISSIPLKGTQHRCAEHLSPVSAAIRLPSYTNMGSCRS